MICHEISDGSLWVHLWSENSTEVKKPAPLKEGNKGQTPKVNKLTCLLIRQNGYIFNGYLIIAFKCKIFYK